MTAFMAQLVKQPGLNAKGLQFNSSWSENLFHGQAYLEF